MPDVHYVLSPADPPARLYHLRCRIDAPDPAGQVVSLPDWIPGSYLIRDFSKHIVRIAAEDAAGRGLPLERLGKSRWRLPAAAGPVTLDYWVHAPDPSVRGAWLDTRFGLVNGTSVFLRVHGREAAPHAVTLAPPPEPWGRGWRVATALPRRDAPEDGFGLYAAPDYDALIDHPIGLGVFDSVAFETGGVPHRIVLFGRHRCDLDRLAADVERLCAAQLAFLGRPADLDRYLFLLRVVGEGYGGLEHRSSTALLVGRDSLPGPGVGEEAYRELLGLFSHEYFHLWNVKRIKPAAFCPYDLARENHTELLWAFEGFTSYYDDLFLLRAGLVSPAGYLQLLGRTLTRLLRTPGRRVQTLVEASYDAWTKFYQADENAANATVSYYVKGAAVALCLDLLLRREAGSSLDALMQALWRRYGEPGVGVPEDGIERLAVELGGEKIAAFLERALRSTEELPLAECLAEFGVRFNLRPAEGPQDKGGTPGRAAPPVGLGLRWRSDGNGALEVLAVESGGPAQRAGLCPGDRLVAVNGLKASPQTLGAELAAARPGERMRLHHFRGDELLDTIVTLAPPPADTCWLELDERADAERLARRRAWLGI